MNQIFRISESSLRNRRRSGVLIVLVALGIVLAQGYASRQDVLTWLIGGTVIVTIAVVVAARQYKAFARFARTHSLALRDDDMLFLDGATERRVPYSCIERLILSGTLSSANSVAIKCRDLPEDLLYGYEDFQNLVELLLQRAPNAIVRTRGLFMYNGEFKEQRAKRTRP